MDTHHEGAIIVAILRHRVGIDHAVCIQGCSSEVCRSGILKIMSHHGTCCRNGLRRIVTERPFGKGIGIDSYDRYLRISRLNHQVYFTSIGPSVGNSLFGTGCCTLFGIATNSRVHLSFTGNPSYRKSFRNISYLFRRIHHCTLIRSTCPCAV